MPPKIIPRSEFPAAVFANDLQPNILKSHGQGYTEYLTFTFKQKERSAVAAFLKEFKENFLSTFADQINKTLLYKQYLKSRRIEDFDCDQNNKVCCSIGFSGFFFEKFRIPPDYRPQDRMFQRGLAASNDAFLPYYKSERTTSYYKNKLDFTDRYDIVVMLADDRHCECKKIRECLIGLATKLDIINTDHPPKIFYGISPHTRTCSTDLLPLGFKDGLSENRGLEEVATVTLTEETGIVSDSDKLHRSNFPVGSYLYFQRINLNQRSLDYVLGLIEEKLKSNGSIECSKIAASLLMGRYPNGVPIVAYPDDDDPEVRSIMPFGYAGDRAGKACPFQAHIRLVNPRHGSGVKTSSNNASIVRRSTYYNPSDDSNSDGIEVEGINFVSYQSSLDVNLRQIFSRMKLKGLRDPIAYGKDRKVSFEIPGEYTSSKRPENIKIDWEYQVAEYQEGEFFYVPSISRFKYYVTILKAAQKDEG